MTLVLYFKTELRLKNCTDSTENIQRYYCVQVKTKVNGQKRPKFTENYNL